LILESGLSSCRLRSSGLPQQRQRDLWEPPARGQRLPTHLRAVLPPHLSGRVRLTRTSRVKVSIVFRYYAAVVDDVNAIVIVIDTVIAFMFSFFFFSFKI
jgi:hypothetical protein